MSHTFLDAKVLVVGGAGFVGSTLVHQILEQAPREIIVVDNMMSSDVANISKGSHGISNIFSRLGRKNEV
jgi:UDP-glucose 4-epimerase